MSHLNNKLLDIALVFLVYFATHSHSEVLSTRSRWIVDAKSGQRVKLACVNWPGHLHAMIPEGLQKKPVKDIAASVASMGFNCVRLTWATYMFTKDSSVNLTAAQSLDRWNLTAAKAGVAANNPQLLDLDIVDVQKAVIDELGAQNLMVVLDNHVSLPKWCCDNDDGNGFFGDKYFDPKEWVQGLTMVAKRYKGNPTLKEAFHLHVAKGLVTKLGAPVVAMSLRNELRGPRQNENDWYQYIQEGATAIHGESPDLLVIVSGLIFDTNLSFLRNRPMASNFNKKLVYEAHWYPFNDPPAKWLHQTNEFCANTTSWFMSQSGFLLSGKNPVPLFLSEFGKDQSDAKEDQNRYFSCLLAYLAETDIDWSLWTLQGSYMLREGQIDQEETFGMLDFSWDHLRNPTVREMLKFTQKMNQDPQSKHPTSYVMYHPQSGRCVEAGNENLTATGSQNCSRWRYSKHGNRIKLLGTSGCLTAVGDGLPAVVSNHCSSQKSKWRIVSSSKLHVTAKDDQGRDLCLELNSSNPTLVTKKCLCLGDDLKDAPSCEENPQRQWFKFVPTRA
ncbi:hypothetical protein RJ639_038262 [Escallonia herrerae]|uniref:Glycoside hydrolase family 5 domain-containing protein n=1 Tax=Escallonia herrerae TaxID=1293975 RepID=A0AA88WRP8_9ASTE|nr:hypothetical protein RJ639_038262 [Escallonia herrerae]